MTPRARVTSVERALQRARPYGRWLVRFLALPYCYFALVDWRECPRSRAAVARDFLHLFFVLKHFPVNYGMHRLWEQDRRDWARYFGSVYDPFQRHAIDRELTPRRNEVLVADKHVEGMMMTALGIPSVHGYGELDPDTDYRSRIEAILDDEPRATLFLKPSRGSGGRGAHLARKVAGEVRISGAAARPIPLGEFRIDRPHVVQRTLEQHPELARVNPHAVNTIRFVTLLSREGRCHRVGAFIRFGVGGAFVDNRARGGLGVRIDLETGTLRGPALDYGGRRYDAHPETCVTLDGFRLPDWSEVLRLATETQEKLPWLKFLGHDIALTPDGPIHVELNSHPDTLGFEQVCGPLFARRETWEVFRSWGLLISEPTRRLYAA